MKKFSDQLVDYTKARDLAGMRKILKTDPEAAQGSRAIGAAAGMAWLDGLALLRKHGADINAIGRGYRPLHVLIQEEPHADHGKPSAERIACLKWLLKNGGATELEGGWPPARPLLTAAFTGVEEYIEILRTSGAKVDGFVHAALGDVKKVEKRLKEDAGFANARTSPRGTTALHCCAASRLKSGDLTAVARVLLDHGADPNAMCQSWNHLVLRSRSMPAPYFLHSLAPQDGHDHNTRTNFSKSLPVRCFCVMGTPHFMHFSDSGTGTAFMPVFTGADLYR
jgi:hypothetical protein